MIVISVTNSSLNTGCVISASNRSTHRISLPKDMVRAGGEDKEGCAALKTCLSTDQHEVDFDTSSDISSELSFGFEFAQAEVMMKGMGNNGETRVEMAKGK